MTAPTTEAEMIQHEIEHHLADAKLAMQNAEGCAMDAVKLFNQELLGCAGDEIDLALGWFARSYAAFKAAIAASGRLQDARTQESEG
jgi:hypothetical protein